MKTRPERLEGKTHKTKLACGSLYVTVNLHDDKPYEIFAALGKSGGCARAQCETAARLVSLALQGGIELLEIIRQMVGISCHARLPRTSEQPSSGADAIGRILKSYIKEPAYEEKK